MFGKAPFKISDGPLFMEAFIGTNFSIPSRVKCSLRKIRLNASRNKK